MRLKRLEISGFKSFAKNTVLEFPNPISAVVGPNGSGKSNVADSIRWVLGEQSIKTLRGKKGEDLIYSGSNEQARLSKASVELVFDNIKREFPLEFDEVAIGRRVYRDGANEYLLNGSNVRLKDIIELLAKVGFGSSQHHIIGQGEADRILYASPKERREMIEDALGLKIFQIKRLEAERKLDRTKDNIKQVEALRREIQPHLKFLKTQAEKFEIASKLREDLKSLFYEYLSRKGATVEKNKKELEEKSGEPEKNLAEIESEIKKLRQSIEKNEQRIVAPEKSDGDGSEKKLAEVRESRVKIQYELGRLQGMIELEERNLKEQKEAMVPRKDVEGVMETITMSLSALEEESALDKIFERIKEVEVLIKNFLKNIKGERAGREDFLKENRTKYEEFQTKLAEIRKEEEDLAKKISEKTIQERKVVDEARREERKVYELESEASRIKDNLRAFQMDKERVQMASDEFSRELEEATPYLAGEELVRMEPYPSLADADATRKKIERLKIRLEEAGGIDPQILKEYKEITERDEFLFKELSDLEVSAKDLGEVMEELEKKLDHDFKTGVSKINHEFGSFFATMFGGGSAALKIVKREIKKEAVDELEGESEESSEEGIDISVDLPRKRIKSLDLLSGGERALTSIALLFAMSAVNPPPFLVLDETDAALDEANSQRYGKMLEDLSKTTQLIVITHNRTTMKTAWVLYGVTMGSDGISKLLSIRFEDAGALVA
ncbi:hypothetical protein A2Z53_02830 [Candidatus Giovannonibacteria bacterium RIFCSPHIGHO2_02_42_15]|uniref:RecF/RecN/SMC N-terminal domain-containing protein n=2 Tax=Candidatus Giovannoniibacteriota TaxID=1752738 RepID=A0A1F5VMN7_9BACT|nr:MAG: Chromosome partition protein Smc [Candidatus Giovannonibacteria bacterium GW2011_GWF2_42_19]OGF64650.1 MAG: hypothetical protein A2Z53_02830 [Candidatus Giovannonibacteria bacterium RIFCSPHIGHO2_02_42_15]